MRERPAATTAAVVGLLALVATLGLGDPARPRAAAANAPAPTPPGPGAMSVYRVTNPNAAPLNVQHVFTDPSGFSYSFWGQVPAGATGTTHVRDIPQIPSPFDGTVTLYADHPFTAQIVGYDDPTPTPAPTATVGSATASATASRTPTRAPTSGPTTTPTASSTRTATATPTPWPPLKRYLPVVFNRSGQPSPGVSRRP